MNKIIKILIAIMFCQFNCGCREQIDNEKDLLKWMSDPENGLVKEKIIGELILTAKYLPGKYLVYRELKNNPTYTQEEFDSISEAYEYTRTFILNIGLSGNNSGADVMFSGVENYEEYANRALEMNFEMSEYIVLSVKNKEYRPKLSNLENVYGLKNSRNIYIVFIPDNNKNELYGSEDIDLIFEDPFFNSGISHFRFNTKQIDNLPELSFLKKNINYDTKQ